MPRAINNAQAGRANRRTSCQQRLKPCAIVNLILTLAGSSSSLIFPTSHVLTNSNPAMLLFTNHIVPRRVLLAIVACWLSCMNPKTTRVQGYGRITALGKNVCKYENKTMRYGQINYLEPAVRRGKNVRSHT